MGDGFHPFWEIAVVRAYTLVSGGHAATADGFTRPPFAYPVIGHQMGDSFPLGSGPHYFFPRRSFEATLTSIASASIRFSLAFSSYGARSRLASDISLPPNLAFHF